MSNDVIIPSLFSLIFTLTGLVFAFCACLVFYRSYRRVSRWKTCSGSVVDYVSCENRNRSYYYPKVEFTGMEGESVVFVSSIGSNRKPYGIGKNVRVLYSPDNIDEADIRSFTNLWLIPGFMIFFALAFVGTGLGIAFHWL